MSQTTDKVKNHSVWQNMTSLGAIIDQSIEVDGIDSEAVDVLERIRVVLAITGKRLASSDPSLILTGTLDGISTGLQNAHVELQQYVADMNCAHVTNANSHIDSIIPHLPNLIVSYTPDETGALKDAAVAYRKTLEVNLEKASGAYLLIRGEADASKTKLNELAGEISAERQRLASMQSEFQSQFSTSQETRNRDFTEAQATRQNTFSTHLTDYAQKLADINLEYSRQKDSLVLQ